MSRQPPTQQAPPALKVRLCYAKRGAARFTSHRDFGRALERALRRAEIPMAYSSGFTPHPRIVYANASPTSAASEAEYVELGLSEICDPAKVMAALNDVLPTGFEVLAAAEARREPLGDLLEASEWRVCLPDSPPTALAAAIAALLAAPECNVSRMTKNGMRTFDVRAAILALEAVDDDTFNLTSLQQAPLVRPDDVVTALRSFDDALIGRPMLTRVRQGPLVNGAITDPLSLG